MIQTELFFVLQKLLQFLSSKYCTETESEPAIKCVRIWMHVEWPPWYSIKSNFNSKNGLAVQNQLITHKWQLKADHSTDRSETMLNSNSTYFGEGHVPCGKLLEIRWGFHAMSAHYQHCTEHIITYLVEMCANNWIWRFL